MRSIRLVNFKCFRDQTFNLRPVTLLSGLNDTGKTAFLKSLLLLHQSYQSGTLPSHGLKLNGNLVDVGTVGDSIFDQAGAESMVGIEIDRSPGSTYSWWFKTWNEQLEVFPVVIGSLVPIAMPACIHYLSSCQTGKRMIFPLLDEARPGSVIIIEHPEFGWHGSIVTTIGGVIARAAARGVQVIVETHSDHLFNALRIAIHEGTLTPDQFNCLHFSRVIRPAGTGIEIEEIVFDRRGRTKHWPPHFFDEWENSLGTLLDPITTTSAQD
jgi:AAA ATPase domain/Protein of unknown function (DUF3696)